MTPYLPRSLWPALWRSTGRTWPPTTIDCAKQFVIAAKQEYLFPLLCDSSDLPEAVSQVLALEREAQRAFIGRAAVITERIQRLAGVLTDLQVSFIVLKGGAFRHYLYHRPHQRPLKDIDILVSDGEKERVAKLLIGSGLTRFYPGTVSSHAPSHHETALGFGTVVVDLHQRFAQQHRYRVDYGSVWNRTVPLEGKGFAARRLSDADALLYLTISSALKNLRAPMIMYVDLWLMLRSNPDCLDEAASLAGRWQVRHAFYTALRQATWLFPEFEPLLTDALKRSLRRPSRTFLDHFVVPTPFRTPSRIPRLEQIWTKYWLMDNFVRRARFAAEHVRETIQGFIRVRKESASSSRRGVADGAA